MIRLNQKVSRHFLLVKKYIEYTEQFESGGIKTKFVLSPNIIVIKSHVLKLSKYVMNERIKG